MKTQLPKMMEGQLRFTSISTADTAALRKFTEETFGWKFLQTLPTPDGSDFYVFETPGGARGGIGRPGRGQAVGSVPYVNVADIKDAASKIEKAGGEIVLPPSEVPGQGWQLHFRYRGSPVIACWQDLAS